MNKDDIKGYRINYPLRLAEPTEDQRCSQYLCGAIRAVNALCDEIVRMNGWTDEQVEVMP
jgi:hypothetical protein